MRTLLCLVFSLLFLLPVACFDMEGTRADLAEKVYLHRLDSMHKVSFNLAPGAQTEKLNELLALGRKKGYRKLQANALLELAIVQNLAGHYDTAVQFSRMALEALGNDTSQLLSARIYNEMGIAYDNRGQYRLSLEQYQKAERFFEEREDTRGLIHIQNNIALIYQNLHDLPKAERMLRKALKLVKQKPEFVDERTMIVSNLASVLEESGHYQDALPYFREVLEADRQTGVKTYIVSSLHNLGELFVNLRKTDSARWYLDTAIILKKSLDAQGTLVNSYLAYAQLFLQDSLPWQADSVLSIAMNLARKSGAAQQMQESYALRTQILRAKRDPFGALTHLDSAYRLKDSIGTARYNAELNGLEKDAALSKAGQDLETQQRINEEQNLKTVALAVLVLLMLGSSVWIYMLYRRQLRLMRALHHRKLQIEEFLQRQTRFLGFLAHEIRNPLSGIIGLNNLMLDEKGLPPLARQYIGYMRDASMQLLNLLNNLLDSQKMSKGSLVLREVPVHMRELLTQVRSLYQGLITHKKIKLDFHYDPLIPETVMGDPVRLSQVFSNLLHNAVKFSPLSGTVQLVVTVMDITPGEIILLCSVKDDGPGIDPADLQTIFEEYGQSTSQDYLTASTGLGLSLSQQILKKMGSHLEVETKPGQGARFSFRLALKKQSRPPL